MKCINNVYVSGVHSAGRGIGEVGARKYYLNGAIPGETVDIAVERRQKRGFLIGEIEAIIQKSVNRVAPFCKHAGVCGGCNWQHINYAYQLELKRQILKNAFEKYDIKSPALPEVAPSPLTRLYRNKTEFHFSSQNDNDNVSHIAGFHPLDKPKQVIQINECYLQDNFGVSLCKAVTEYATQNNLSFYDYQLKTGLLRSIGIRNTTVGERMVVVGFAEPDSKGIDILMQHIYNNFPEIHSLYHTVYTNLDKGYMDSDMILYPGKEKYITEKFEHLTFKISPRSFFQPNPLQAINIYKKIAAYAQLRGHELVYDLYTGTGTIACFIAANAFKVIGIEGSADAIGDAKINAINNGITNTQFIVGDILETFNQTFMLEHGKPNVIILDPPRAGTLIEIKKAMMNADPEKIIYVSCNPVSLAWDLKQLTEKYIIKDISLFDMFPHTHHLESVVLLERS